MSADDPRPAYLQVADVIRAGIADGTLAPGERLESGRDLAKKYGVAVMTMQKALAMLRDEHVLITRQGHGTFVARAAPEPPPRSPEYVEISRQLGELREMLEHTVRHLDTRLSALEKTVRRSPDAP